MKAILKIFKYLLILAVALIAIVLILGLFVKKDYNVTREIIIKKAPASVFDYVSKLKNQNEYGTWYKYDTAMKQTFIGTDGTVGFSNEWESKHEKVGNGKQTITKIDAGKSMESELLFKGPVDFKSFAKIAVEPVNDSTSKVLWSMWGKSPYPFNVMNLFMSMDDAIGKDYSEGLVNLKKVLEAK